MHMMREMCTKNTWQTGTLGQRARWHTSAEVYAGKLEGERLRVAARNSSSLDVVETSFLKAAVTNGGHVCAPHIGRHHGLWYVSTHHGLCLDMHITHTLQTHEWMYAEPSAAFFRIIHLSDPINMDSCHQFWMTRTNKYTWKVTHGAALQCMWQCIPRLSLPPQPTHELGWACRHLHVKDGYMHQTLNLKKSKKTTTVHTCMTKF